MIDGIPNRPLYFYQKDIIAGHQAGDVLDHVLMVKASRTTATDETLAITGASRRSVPYVAIQLRYTPYT